jgi:hypothetical protein
MAPPSARDSRLVAVPLPRHSPSLVWLRLAFGRLVEATCMASRSYSVYATPHALGFTHRERMLATVLQNRAARHTTLAALSRLRREGPRSPSGWKASGSLAGRSHRTANPTGPPPARASDILSSWVTSLDDLTCVRLRQWPGLVEREALLAISRRLVAADWRRWAGSVEDGPDNLAAVRGRQNPERA